MARAREKTVCICIVGQPETDKDITKRLYDAGELIGIHLHDHIVIGRCDDGSYEYYSMKENGIIP